jgi:hypothetical protein
MLLTIELEERMKRLWNSPAYIAPSSPEVLLENLAWVSGNNELKDMIFVRLELPLAKRYCIQNHKQVALIRSTECSHIDDIHCWRRHSSRRG